MRESRGWTWHARAIVAIAVVSGLSLRQRRIVVSARLSNVASVACVASISWPARNRGGRPTYAWHAQQERDIIVS